MDRCAICQSVQPTIQQKTSIPSNSNSADRDTTATLSPLLQASNLFESIFQPSKQQDQVPQELNQFQKSKKKKKRPNHS